MSNVFGEGTPAERFNKAFNDTLVGRDITDTIGKAEISTERAEKIQEGSLGGAGGGTTNNIIDASDNSITDQSQNSGGFFSGVMDYIPFFGNEDEAQSLAK